MEMELINQLMEENMKGNGNSTWGKEKEFNCLKMAPNFKANIIRIKKMEKENFIGQMVMFMKVTLGIINVKVKVQWDFRMVDNIKVNGLMIKCMGMVSLRGLMEKDMRDNICKIRSMEKDNLIMEMDLIIRETGRRVDNMEEENLKEKMERLIKESFNMDNLSIECRLNIIFDINKL